MTAALPQVERNRQARQTLAMLEKSSEHCLLIHYSCESFYDRVDGTSPRITSIAVRNLSSGQTKSFSIHQVAELRGVAASVIGTSYDSLERDMLDSFYRFIGEHSNDKWVHWNMRDANYGFEALGHRYKVLGGEPCQIDSSRKYDLSRILIDMFGVSYVKHPRLQNILLKNGIQAKDMLSGHDEAIAFTNGEYGRLHQSTLRKVDVLADILQRAASGKIKSDSWWWQRYGLTPRGVLETLQDQWIWVCFVVASVVLGVITVAYSLLA